MGTKDRRARDKANLREEILDAARALFTKQGYENVSIRMIANRVEYSPGTIYLYFEDKAQIFVTLCDETFAKLHTRLGAIAADPSEPLEKLRRAGRAYIQFAIDYPEHYALVFSKSKPTLNLSEQVHRSGMRCYEDLCHIVQQCIDAKLLRVDDVQEVSQSVWAAVHGVADLVGSLGEFQFVEHSRLIDSVVEMAVRGFMA